MWARAGMSLGDVTAFRIMLRGGRRELTVEEEEGEVDILRWRRAETNSECSSFEDQGSKCDP